MTKAQQQVLDEIEQARGKLDELEHSVRSVGRPTNCMAAAQNLANSMLRLNTTIGMWAGMREDNRDA